MTLRVHFHTFIEINRLDLPVNVSTVLHVHRCTFSSLYLFSLFLLFWHNMHNDISTHILGTYLQIHPKINLPVYPHAFPLPKNKDLPVTTTTCVHAHTCTRSGPYLSIFILLFRLTVKIYPSTFLHVHRCTRSSVYLFSLCLFPPGITCTRTFQLT